MKKTILIPKIKPPDVNDIVNNQLNGILSSLEQSCDLEVIWLIFQPYRFDDYTYEGQKVVDFHQFKNGIEVLEYFKPDLIISEVRLSFNPVAFTIAGNKMKIPLVTITQIGISLFMNDALFSAKSTFRVLLSNKVLGDKKHTSKKLYMLRYILKKYLFFIRTLHRSSFGILKTISLGLYFPFLIFFSKENPPINKIGSGLINFCFNPHSVDRLTKSGFDKSSLVLEGDPAFDGLHKRLKSELPPQKKSSKIKILFCPTPMHEHGRIKKSQEDEIILNIINMISANPSFDLSLKIHPSTSSFKEYEDLLKNSQYSIPLYQKEDVIELLNEADVMLTYGSSDIILESILLKKYVIIYKIPFLNEENRLFDNKLMLETSNISDLPTSINDLIKRSFSKEHFDAYIQTQIGKFDGKNSERIANRILKLFKN
jgi:hypothetical protein